MLSVGSLMWISCRPLIRLIICVGCGFGITKADIFSPIAARGTSQIILNITFPCLMFSKIVPAFTSQNIGALAPLVVVAILYEAMGIVIAWIIKQTFWVPHRFRYGIFVAGGWGNYGDIPTSVLMSLTGAAPFNGTPDQNLSVAYISAFILVFLVTLFPFGGHRWIAMDFVGPDVEPEEVRDALRLKHHKWFNAWGRTITQITRRRSEREHSKDIEIHSDSARVSSNNKDPRPTGVKHVSFHDDTTTAVPTDEMRSQMCSPSSSEPDTCVNSPELVISATYALQNFSPAPAPVKPRNGLESGLSTNLLQVSPIASIRRKFSPPPPVARPRRLNIFLANIRTFFSSLITPPSMSIIISFPIAMIPHLKSLFVVVPGTYIHPAPDGQPPLAFIMDIASFIGTASVPIGLICLGSALARLKIPRNQWNALPIGAIACLAVGKILMMPVLGVLICQGMVKVGFIPKEDKVLQFVCIFFSCLPTATTQVFLTQVYSGTGSAEDISAFLIPQYILMFISMTALTAYTLQLLF